MATQAPPKTGFEKWQDGINKAIGDAKWDSWDCEIQMAVNEYNRHLSGTAGYFPLDWQIIKAMVWVETLKKLNPTAAVLRHGQILKYQKASVQRVITNWRHISTTLVAQRYNGGGDPAYAKKLDYALSLVRKGKAALCAQ